MSNALVTRAVKELLIVTRDQYIEQQEKFTAHADECFRRAKDAQTRADTYAVLVQQMTALIDAETTSE